MSLANTRALCTLADLKADLGISDSSQDTRLEGRILAASALIEEYLGRKLKREVAKVEPLAGYGTPRLIVSLTPVETLSAIAFNGATVDAGLWSLEDADLGFIFNAGFWTNTGVVTLSASPYQRAGDEQKLYSVTYTGGFWLPNDSGSVPGTAVLLPYPITEACLSLATVLHRRKGRDTSVQAETVGEASRTYGIGKEGAGAALISGYIAEMLAPYKRPI